MKNTYLVVNHIKVMNKESRAMDTHETIELTYPTLKKRQLETAVFIIDITNDKIVKSRFSNTSDDQLKAAYMLKYREKLEEFNQKYSKK